MLWGRPADPPPFAKHRPAGSTVKCPVMPDPGYKRITQSYKVLCIIGLCQQYTDEIVKFVKFVECFFILLESFDNSNSEIRLTLCWNQPLWIITSIPKLISQVQDSEVQQNKSSSWYNLIYQVIYVFWGPTGFMPFYPTKFLNPQQISFVNKNPKGFEGYPPSLTTVKNRW